MRVHAGLAHSPLFVPAVGNYYQGMLVQVPLQLWALPATPKPGDLRDALADHYAGQDFVSVATAEESKGLEGLDPEGLNGTNDLRLYVFRSEEHTSELQSLMRISYAVFCLQKKHN